MERTQFLYTSRHFAQEFKYRLGRFIFDIDREVMLDAINLFEAEHGPIINDDDRDSEPAKVPVIIDRKEWLICVKYSNAKKNYVGITILERRR